MLYSVVDDRSGVAYQEYHGVYGEDVEAALRFMFAAMSKKAEPNLPFEGIPQMLYMDNGPIAKSLVFQKVMKDLGIDVRTHLPQGKDGRRVTARSKGKVERPCRSVKEMHETVYLAFLAERLTTPLQIEHYLRLSFEKAYQAATKPVTVGILEAVLATGLNDLEPRLIRHGYNAKVLAELLNIRVSEVNSFLRSQLPPGRTEDLRDQMLKIGIPLYA